MKANWLNENLCSFDEKTRIELGPQLVELKCTDANLRDEVTAPHYRIGKIDALGKVIMPERTIDPLAAVFGRRGSVAEGEMMTCVDWREKHKPKVWKIYQLQKRPMNSKETLEFKRLTEALKTNKNLNPVEVAFMESRDQFIQVGEDESKEDALDFAEALAGEM